MEKKLSSLLSKNYKKCVICNKRRIPGSNVHLVRIPLDPERCRLWIKAIGQEELVDLPIEKLHELKFVCNIHFQPGEFNESTKRLVKHAVPTLNLPLPPLQDELFSNFPLHIGQYPSRGFAEHLQQTSANENQTPEMIQSKTVLQQQPHINLPSTSRFEDPSSAEVLVAGTSHEMELTVQSHKRKIDEAKCILQDKTNMEPRSCGATQKEEERKSSSLLSSAEPPIPGTSREGDITVQSYKRKRKSSEAQESKGIIPLDSGNNKFLVLHVNLFYVVYTRKTKKKCIVFDLMMYSFKSKQLVRSQAIRESQSPPRTSSPATEIAVIDKITVNEKTITVNDKTIAVNENNVDNVTDASSQSGDTCIDANSFSDSKSSFSEEFKKQPVEIQITPGAWDDQTEQRQRTKRWLGHRHHSDSSRDLLSNNPRVACVCGACSACVHCRGRRRRNLCPTKQDSGIVCSDDCPDCSDSEHSGVQNEDGRKSDTPNEDQTFYCRCPERKDVKPKTISLSRNDSDDRSEPSGAELVSFIKQTLNKNARDRMTLLKIEKELRALVNDTGRCIVRFPVMTSYGRMLVHRCASLFQLSHHLDQNNKTCVLVSKSGTSGGRIPCTGFRQWCTAAFPPSPQRHPHQDTLAKSILKRDTHSLDEPGNCSLSNARSKSLEQREREYERVRRRIFSSDNCNQQDESQWPWTNSGPVKVLTPEAGRNKLLKVQSLESGSGPPQSWRGRGAVAKSHSFGGYGGDGGAPLPHPHRVLSKQGDLASSSWRLSPSSSGYKTLSLRSTDSVTPSPTGGASPEPAASYPAAIPTVGGAGEGNVVWCVTDLLSVPAGAMLIHPQTGRPITNPDGSIYHFDPANPPVLYDTCAQMDQQKIDAEKRRGRLEKQHSFIDSECECQPTEECRSKCCCECRRHEGCQQKHNAEKITPQSEPKSSKPTTPIKRLENQNQTNHNPEQNHRTHETNQKPEPRHYETKRFENSNFERQFENRQVEQTNQRPFEHPPANQRPTNDVANQRAVPNNFTRQDSNEVQYGAQYQPGVRNDEVTSPPQVSHYQQDTPNMQAMAQAKMTPVPMPDPNIRPMSLTNMMYPAITQGYPYVNQCRIDQPLQPMYQPIIPEEQKQLAPSPHAAENTFRIDPSYPYAGVDYSQCGACVDPAALQQRSYNVSYGQMEAVPTVLPPYPINNVVIPQPPIQHYPYADPLQWTGGVVPIAPKLLVPELYPAIYPCPPYNMYHPQVVPAPYPVCPPVYAGAGSARASARASACGSARSTPAPRQDDARNTASTDKNLSRQNSNEIAAKIQQIKEQMSQLNTRDRREEWRTGTGILGSCPVPNPPERRPPNDETQLTSAARAIVNTIRNMQAKTYHQDRRPEQFRPDRRRPDDRNKPDDRQYLFRQMSPGTWCRRSPAPNAVHPVFNHPRRPHPDNRNQRR